MAEVSGVLECDTTRGFVTMTDLLHLLESDIGLSCGAEEVPTEEITDGELRFEEAADWRLDFCDQVELIYKYPHLEKSPPSQFLT